MNAILITPHPCYIIVIDDSYTQSSPDSSKKANLLIIALTSVLSGTNDYLSSLITVNDNRFRNQTSISVICPLHQGSVNYSQFDTMKLLVRKFKLNKKIIDIYAI